jgi:hypothetical protein
VDVAHPINSECRARFQKVILDSFHTEVEKSKSPGYVPPDLHEPEEDSRHPKPAAAEPPSAEIAAAP